MRRPGAAGAELGDDGAGDVDDEGAVVDGDDLAPLAAACLRAREHELALAAHVVAVRWVLGAGEGQR